VNFHEQAMRHSSACLALLNEGRLKEVLRYCSLQHVEPPQCMAAAVQAHQEQDFCAHSEQLCDYGWWLKRLRILAKRDAEKQRFKFQFQAAHI